VADIQELDTSSSGGSGWTVTIGECAAILDDCHLGDSICVNGACLTVTEFDANSFKVGLAPETLFRTDLGRCCPPTSLRTYASPGELKLGSKVNLERAMQMGARYGGHSVQVSFRCSAPRFLRVY
jgi:riboflavin synthase